MVFQRNKQLRIYKKKMIRELGLRYLGIEARFLGFHGRSGDSVTTETYYSDIYKCLVVIFRDLPSPICVKFGKRLDECWTCWIDQDTSEWLDLNDLYTNVE